LKAYHNDVIVSFERVETLADSSSKEVEQILNNDDKRYSFIHTIQDLVKHYGLPPIGDLHSNNIGVNKNGELVAIDYAL
jgi:hypothetical protein